MDSFIALMRRYCIQYVNCHDFSVLPEIMVENYVLSMGEHTLRGRDAQYVNAARIQMTDIPGMQLTVHDIITNGDRLAMRFSEHGASIRQDGKLAVWAGIALYHRHEGRLTHCRVEQDYHARRRQYELGEPDRVDAPAVAPWDTLAAPKNDDAERIVRSWIDEGMPRRNGVAFDDEWLDVAPQDILAPNKADVLDIFSAGESVAFHVRQEGALKSGFLKDSAAGAEVFLHSTGVISVSEGAVATGRVVRDRLGLERRLRNKVVKVA